MPPPDIHSYDSFLGGNLPPRKRIAGLSPVLELWRKSLDLDLSAEIRSSRFKQVIAGFEGLLQPTQTGWEGEQTRSRVRHSLTRCLWKDLEYLSVEPEPARVSLCLKMLIKALSAEIDTCTLDAAESEVDLFFAKFYLEISDVLTAEGIPLHVKSNVIESYLQALVCCPPNIALGHSHLIRQCRLEGYALLFDVISQQALQLWDAKKVNQARSVLLAQESALVVAVDLEEGMQKDLRSPKRARDIRRFFTRVSDVIVQEGQEGGYTYTSGRIKRSRSDFMAYCLKCEAQKYIDSGDLHFAEAMTLDGGSLLARAQLAQDDYRVALRCAYENDLDLEGTALVRLARFFGNIMSSPQTAHTLFLRAVQLALTMSPKNPTAQWYATATEAVQAHRNKLAAKENEKWENKKEKIKEGMKATLLLLDAHSRANDKDFVEFIWSTFYPKTPGSTTLPQGYHDGGNKVTRKAMIQIVARYHPDKCLEVWGDEYKVLSEEICKQLTRRYQSDFACL